MLRLIALSVLVMATSAQAAEMPQIRIEPEVSFKAGTGLRITGLKEILEEFEYYDDAVPRVFQWDLNGDNKYETLIKANESMCGKGGCDYILIDGMSGRRIANLFGSHILVLKKKKGQSFPDLQTYSSSGANQGTVDTYSYRNRKYVSTSHVQLSGNGMFRYTESLYKLPVAKSR